MRSRSLVATAAVVGLVSLALAGCSAPKPVATTVAAVCSPASAKYFWGKGQRASDVPLGVHILSYGPGGVTQVDKTFVVEPTYTASLLTTLASQSHTSIDSWKKAILLRAQKRPTMGSWYGAQVPVGKNFVTIDKPIDGSYIVDVVENQLELPVVVTCGANDPVSGTITAAIAGGMGGYAIRCGSSIAANNLERVGAAADLKFCPTS